MSRSAKEVADYLIEKYQITDASMVIDIDELIGEAYREGRKSLSEDIREAERQLAAVKTGLKWSSD